MIQLVTFFSYILATFGCVELMIFFDGPFSVLDHFRKLMHSMHPKLGELFTCPAYLSSWIGILSSSCNYFFLPSVALTPFNMILSGTGLWWLIIPLDMFLTAGTTWTLYQLDEYLENNSKTYEE